MDGQEMNLWPYILAAVWLAGFGPLIIGLLLQSISKQLEGRKRL